MCPTSYISFSCQQNSSDPSLVGYYYEDDGFIGSYIDIRTKQGFGQYAEYLIEAGKYCKIRVLYDENLFDENAPSLLRKK